MKCEDCGNDEGYTTVCPYESEINNDNTEVCLCSVCYDLRADEI